MIQKNNDLTNSNGNGQIPRVANVEIEFSNPPALDEVKWNIIVGKNGDRLRVIENPDVEMLFAGENAGLLFSVYPTVEHIKKPDEIELTVRTAYVKRQSTKPDWNTIAQDIKESGTRMTAKVLMRPDEVDTFLSAAAPVMARRGEWRIVEFLLGDEVIGNFLSWGEGLCEFNLWTKRFAMTDDDNRIVNKS